MSRPRRPGQGAHRPGRSDPVGEARRRVDEAEQLVRSGRLDHGTVRELEIAITQLRADLTNGEDPATSLGRIDRLVDRSR